MKYSNFKSMRAIPKWMICLLSLTLCIPALSQVTVTNVGEVIFFPAGSIHINGNYVNSPTASSATNDPQIFLGGSLFITGNLINNGALNIIAENDSPGLIEFSGPLISEIDGTSSVLKLNNLSLNKAGSLTLKRNVEVLSNLQLISGNIDLQNFDIDLRQTGSLVGENDARRIFSSGIGAISHTLNMAPTSISDNPGGLGFHLYGSLLAGIVIRRGHNVQLNAGDGSIERYYDINLNGGDIVQEIRLNYLSTELNGLTESELRLYISFDGGSSWQKIGGNANTALNYVELTGLNITSNFRITLSDKDCVAPPMVDLGLPTQNLCTGTSLNLDAGNPGSNYQWSTAEVSQIISVSVAGTYSVTVTDVKGCIGFDTVDLISRPSPVVAFNNSISCEGQVMNFTNNSNIASGSMTYAWDFGDPGTTSDNSTATNPSYTYPVDGDYSVSLTATSDFNCITNLVKNVTSFPIPFVDFSLTPACLGIQTGFTNESTIPVGGMTYFWDFGDGNTSTQTNPSSLFGSISSYNVMLTATSNANCINSVSKVVDVHYTPVADFAIGNVCELIDITASNNSSIISGSLSYNWDFGDGTISTDAIPVKSYATGGPYIVSLTVVSDFNCVDVVTKPVDIYINPVASFTVADDCQNKVFTFSNSSTSAQGSPTYQWDFGDGNFSTAIIPSRNYSSPGFYDVELIATTNLGCTNIQVRNLEIFPVPQTNFTVSNVCEDIPANFNNGTNIASGVVTYVWDFGDGVSSILTDPTNNYISDGAYNVQLISTSDRGCVSSLTKPLEIYPLPEVDFGGVIVTCGVSFLLDASNAGSTYLWSDGSTNQQFPVTQNGIYDVTITSINGCSTFESVDITLQGEVVPNLGDDKTVCGGVLLDAGYPGSNYLWSTGATTKTILANITGTYGVTITDQNGCFGYDEVFVTVNPIPVVSLGPDLEVCADQSVILDAGNIGATFAWSNGTNQKTLNVLTSGTYSVNVTNAFGCVGNDDVNIVINPLPVVPFSTTMVVCDQVALNAGNLGSTYLWSDDSTGSSISVTSSGTYSVQITTDKGCYLFAPSNVTVHTSAVVELGTDIELCFGESVILNAGNQGDSYSWSNGSTNPTLTVSTSGLYKVDVARTNGCITSDAVSVTIFPEIQNNLKKEYALCANAPLFLDGFSGQGVSYEWRNAQGLISNQNSYSLNTPQKLWLVTRDIKGCVEVDSVNVQVDPDPITSRFLVATLVDAGDSVRFVQFAFPDPISFEWDFADGLKSTIPDPVHTYLRSGDFNASLTVGDLNDCFDTKAKIITVRLLRDEDIIEIDLPFIELIDAKLYPNPSSISLSVDVELNKEAQILINLYSLNGVLIDSKVIDQMSSTIEFDIRNIPSGTYFVKVFVNKQARTMRFVKI